MQSTLARVLAFAGALAGTAAGAGAAIAPVVSPGASVAEVASPPACKDGLDGRVAARSSNGSVHRATIVVTHAGDLCALSGIPAVVSGRDPASEMPVGYLSVPQAVAVGPNAPAAFEIRYVSSGLVASGTAPEACALGFLFDGVPLRMRPFTVHRCERPIEIDLSSVAPGAEPPSEAVEPDRSALDNVPPCKASDFAIRPIDSLAAAPLVRDRYALQNRGASACRSGGPIVVRFLDKANAPVDEHVAVRTDMPLDLVIPRGREASFSVAYAIDGEPCPPVETLSVAFAAPAGGTIDEPLKTAPCRSATEPIDVSDLVLGVPIAAR